MNPRYISHFNVSQMLFLISNVKINCSVVNYLQYNIYCLSCRITLMQLITHLCMIIYLKRIKFYLLVENMYPCKI